MEVRNCRILSLVILVINFAAQKANSSEQKSKHDNYLGSPILLDGYCENAKKYIDMFTMKKGVDSMELTGYPGHISQSLASINTSGVKTLKLFLTAKITDTISDNTFNITYIQHFKELQHLWIIASDATDKYVFDFVQYKHTEELPLTNLHLHIRIRSFNHLHNFLNSLRNLRVLDIQDAPDILNFTFVGIFDAARSHPLVAISLSYVQSLSINRSKYNPHFNFTEVFKTYYTDSLEYLDISRNDIQYLSTGICHALKHLVVLDLSYNMLYASMEHKNLPELFDILFHPALEIIDCGFQGCGRTSHLYNQEHQVRRAANSLQQDQVIDNDHVIKGDQVVKRSTTPFGLFSGLSEATKKCLTESLNTILSNHTKFCWVFNCMVNARSLSGVSISCDLIPPVDTLIDYNCKYGIRFPFSPRLRQVKLNIFTAVLPFRNYVYYETRDDVICIAKNDIHSLDVSYNSALSKNIETLLSNISGLNRVEYLNLESIGNIHITKDSFVRFPEMRFLNIAKNTVSFSYEVKICHNLPKLQSLNLSECGLSDFPRNIFKGCLNLEFLSLRKNLFTFVSSDVRIELDAVASIHSLEIDLTGNVLHCHCHSNAHDTVAWIQRSKIRFVDADEYICLGDSGTESVSLKDLQEYKDSCHVTDEIIKAVIVTSITFGSLFIVILLGIPIRKYRYRLETKYYRTKRRLNQILCSHSNTMQQYSFDVYISYCHSDRHYVQCILLRVLENVYNIKCCIPDRDFPAFGSNMSLIYNHMKQSRVVLVVLSNEAITSPYPYFERNLARHLEIESLCSSKVLYIILDDIRNETTVECILNSKIGYKWQNEASEKQKTEFFVKICSKILRELSKEGQVFPHVSNHQNEEFPLTDAAELNM